MTVLFSPPLEETQTEAQQATATVAAPARALGLDALRGLAIIGMVFSGVFPHESPWAGWMFHAQVGPPTFTYNPTIPGITWVDLVFPFFLFAMGAAIPLAMSQKVKEAKYGEVLVNVIKRGALLLFFAVIIRNMNFYGLQAPDWVNQVTALLTFACFFLVFMRFSALSSTQALLVKVAGFTLIAAMAWAHDSFTGFEFDKSRNDIIIVVLANMAVFGSVIWLFTRANTLLRMGVLALFAAVWLTHGIESSWTNAIWTFHPALSWMYQFMFLKYLCVVLPGTVLGDLMLKYKPTHSSRQTYISQSLLGCLCFALIIVNLYGLYTRQVGFTLGVDAVLCLVGLILVRKPVSGQEKLWQQLFSWGVFLLVLGLMFEPLEGGIKKDPSSFSYWFLTSGLAFFAYILCDILSQRFRQNLLWKSVIQSGQNPMVAYVATAFLITPLLVLTHLSDVLAMLREINVYLGIVRALVITGAVVAVTAYTTRKGWFWRT